MVRYIDTVVYIRIEIRLLVSDCEEKKKRSMQQGTLRNEKSGEKKKRTLCIVH